jgi:hypothetical protein
VEMTLVERTEPVEVALMSEYFVGNGRTVTVEPEGTKPVGLGAVGNAPVETTSVERAGEVDVVFVNIAPVDFVNGNRPVTPRDFNNEEG